MPDLGFDGIQLQAKLARDVCVVGGQNGLPHRVKLAKDGGADLLQGLQCVDKVQVDHVCKLNEQRNEFGAHPLIYYTSIINVQIYTPKSIK